MAKITAQEILDLLKQDLKQCGEHWYYDQSGWHDVVSAHNIDERLRDHTPEDIIAILKEVAKDEHGSRIPSGVLGAYDDDDVMWESLCAVDDNFVSENY